MGRDAIIVFHRGRSFISIHAPRVGRDAGTLIVNAAAFEFQSTRPVWGATFLGEYDVISDVISIHAPRVGRDYGILIKGG